MGLDGFNDRYVVRICTRRNCSISDVRPSGISVHQLDEDVAA
jgi:hypothetical protein